MQVIIGAFVWLIVCVFISSILTGGSSEATTPLTWILFFGAPIGLIMYSVAKGFREKSNFKQESSSVMSKNNTILATTHIQSNTTLQVSAVNKTTQTKPSRLQEKLKLYNILFKNCQTVEDVIRIYMDYNNPGTINNVELEILRHYLQFNSQFKNKIWVRDDLVTLIKADTANNPWLCNAYDLTMVALRFRLVNVLHNHLAMLSSVNFIESNPAIEVNNISSTRALENIYKDNNGKVSTVKDRILKIKKLCSHCKNLDDVIKEYINITPSNLLHSQVEIYVLKHYLQYYCDWCKEVYSSDELKLIIDNANANNKLEKNRVFATFDISEANKDTAYSPFKISSPLIKKNMPYSVFEEMHKIIGNNYYWSKEEIFIKQGKFMEEFSDNYNGNVPFQAYYPSYDAMNNNQLRTYFTWRTKVRNGEIRQTSISYVFVYIYELINNIGVKTANDGIEQLIRLLKDYKSYESQIEDYLVKWIKDYYVCNKFSISFKEIVVKYELESYYPSVIMNKDDNKYSFDTLCDISKYKIENSKFFSEENKTYIAHCFNRAILNLNPLFSLYGTGFYELIFGSNETLSWWRPFSNAVYKDISGADKKVIISNNERYILKNRQWNVYRPAQNSYTAPLILGYIIKRIEANLRQLTNYRHKLSPNSVALIEKIQNSYGVSKNVKAVISDHLFDEIVDEATSIEFSALVKHDDNPPLTPISTNLNRALNEEPYLSFRKMRASEGLKGETNITKRFYKQALILKHLSDNFESIVPFDNYMPTYDEMTNNQLRCYFTWRSRVRSGEYPETFVSYIYLYIFELINNIGENDENKVIEQLTLLLKHYVHLGKSFENMITAYIKDYYICGNFSNSFYEMIKYYDLSCYYPKISVEFSEDYNLEVYQKISSYKIEKSKFYDDKTSPLIMDCFRFLFKNVINYFRENHVDLKQVIVGAGYVKHWWRPFANALYDIKPKSNKRIIVCSNEIYAYKNGEWICEAMPVKDSTGIHLVGYILKRMEVKMREVVKFKYKLSVDVSSIADKLTIPIIKSIVLNPNFDQTIDDAVVQYFKQNHPQVFTNPNAPFQKSVEVTIDISKLDKIRKEAEETREKLIVEDGNIEQSFVPVFDDKNAPAKIEQGSNSADGVYSKLSEIQIQALSIMMNETPSMPLILVLSQKYKILPEVMLEGINEIFLEVIGDNIVETADENPFIYDEYLEEVRAVLGGFR